MTNPGVIGNPIGSPIWGANVAVINSTQNWRVPDGVFKVWVTVIGGGAAGSSGTYISCANQFGGPGFGGGASQKLINVAPGSVIQCTIGAGGSTSGASGGTSSFGSFCSATGGSSSAAGVGAGGDINLYGGNPGWDGNYTGGSGPFSGYHAPHAASISGSGAGGNGLNPGDGGGGGGGGNGGAPGPGGAGRAGQIIIMW